MCHERCNSHPSLTEWQHYYNWERPHSAHNGKTPMEHYFELAEKTPYSDAVHAQTISLDWPPESPDNQYHLFK